MFVDESALPVLSQLRLHFEQPFSFEHDRQNEKRPGVTGIMQFNQLAQERFSILFADGVDRRRGWRFENALPMRNESLPIRGALAELSAPAVLADIQGRVGVFLVEEKSVKAFLIGEMFMARLTQMAAALDIPIDHSARLLAG